MHTFICGFVDDEFRMVDVDVHMSNVLSISSIAGRGLSEQGDCSRDIESKSSSLITVPIIFFRQKGEPERIFTN